MQIIEFAKEYNLGVEVKVAKSGEKAILLHSQGASFDLVLMDMDMPARVTSGYEVYFLDFKLQRSTCGVHLIYENLEYRDSL